MFIETIKKIVESSLQYKVDCKISDSWFFDGVSKDKTLQVNGKDLTEKSSDYVLGKVFDVIGEGLFLNPPDDLLFRLNKKNRRAHSLALGVLEELRIKNEMMYNFPGVRDYFSLGFEYDDNKIAESAIKGADKEITFLYNIRRYFFNKIDNVEKKEYIDYVLKADSTEDLINRFSERLEEYYIGLIEGDDNKDNKGKKPETSEDLSEGLKEKSKSIIEQENDNDKTEDEDKSETKAKGDGFIEEYEEEDTSIVSYKEKFDKIRHLYKKLYSNLSSILEDNRLERSCGGFKSGILDMAGLYKVITNERELFKRKVLNTHKNYSFCILIDESMSMSGQKTELAGLSTILLSEVFNKVGIDFCIYGFNLEFNEYKNIKVPFSNKIREKLKGTFSYRKVGGSGNNDGYAVNKAIDSFIPYSGDSNKIFIVISDGEPAPSQDSIPSSERIRTKKGFFSDFILSNEVKKASKVAEVIGIGIDSDSVKHYYKNYIILKDVSKLPELLLKIITKKIKRG